MALNVELLESSFAQVRLNSADFTAGFYTTLFADYPEVQPLFANADMEAQEIVSISGAGNQQSATA
jgi:hemoglobin-like flavoprotein